MARLQVVVFGEYLGAAIRSAVVVVVVVEWSGDKRHVEVDEAIQATCLVWACS